VRQWRRQHLQQRFGWQLGELPEGYDHKYIYSHLGYNLKPLDLQAAIGRQQLLKLPLSSRHGRTIGSISVAALLISRSFSAFHSDTCHRMEPERIYLGRHRLQDRLQLVRLPRAREESAPFDHSELARALDAAKIGNRMLFGGNLVRQPAFVQLRKDNPKRFASSATSPGRIASCNKLFFSAPTRAHARHAGLRN